MRDLAFTWINRINLHFPLSALFYTYKPSLQRRNLFLSYLLQAKFFLESLRTARQFGPIFIISFFFTLKEESSLLREISHAFQILGNAIIYFTEQKSPGELNKIYFSAGLRRKSIQADTQQRMAIISNPRYKPGDTLVADDKTEGVILNPLESVASL